MSRKRQAVLLIAAWILFMGSLPAPATDPLIPFPPLLIIGYVPVGFIFMAPLFSPISALTSFAGLTVIANLLFLLSPLSLIGTQTPKRQVVQKVISLGLLGVWELPVLVDFFATAQQKSNWGIEHVLWGYYVFAAAHTIAFAAIQLAAAPLAADRGRGFDVVSMVCRKENK